MGLRWILGLASLHEMCLGIHKDGAHSEPVTDRATPKRGTVTLWAPLHPSRAVLGAPGCWEQG